MEKALSDLEIQPFVSNILKYNELSGISPEVLMNMLPVAILYQAGESYGHWTLLLRTPEGIEFFDPYGIIIDKEFKYLEKQQPHYLAKLLYDLDKSGVVINYNPWKFQDMKYGINTCGRWVILRSLFKDWGIDKFANVVDRVSRQLNLTPDEFIVQTIS
jgi:hypothetical protein